MRPRPRVGATAAQALEEDAERLKDLASEAPVIRLVNQMIGRAVETHASDIHVEPFEDRLRVRYRYDGVLHEADSPPARLAPAIISRIKIMAKLDIAERRLPQDGRIKLAVRGTEIDFRVSTITSLYGEKVVLRVLDRSSVVVRLRQAGLARGRCGRLVEGAGAAQRHSAGHRADGSRQDDHALYRADQHQRGHAATSSRSRTRSSISSTASTRCRPSRRSG